MKKLYIVLLAVTSLCVSGCTEVSLDEEPEGLLSPQSFFKSEGDFEAALAGTYKGVYRPWNAFGFDALFALTAGGEDIGATAATLAIFDRMEADGGRFAGDMWGSLYRTISLSNTIVANIDKARSSGVAENVLIEYEGQAKFMRGFSYFYMVRWWGEVQLITDENILIADQVAQSPVADIYTQIVSDLKFAEENLTSLSDPGQTGRASKEAAKALLAKVYLTMAGWPLEDAANYLLARDKAKEVIDGGAFSLESNFADLWVQANRLTNSEFIFAFHGNSAVNASTQHHASRSGIDGGWGDWSSEARFFNAFPDGPRKDATFTSVFSNGETFVEAGIQPFSAKYRDAGPLFPADATGGSSSGDGSQPVLRYADVLLIYAEAASMTAGGTPPAEAISALNQVRRRANGLDINTADASVDWPSVGPADFDDAVIAERNWELAHEANRWFDLVRKKMVIEVNGTLHSGVTETDRLLAKPSAQVAVLKPLLTQNPGYGDD